MTPREIASNTLGDILWMDSHAGFCQCPGEEEHSSGTKSDACMIRINAEGVPYCFCVHASCKDQVNMANQEMLSNCQLSGTVEKVKPTPEEKAAAERRKALRRVTYLARTRVLPKLIADPVPLEWWTENSPYPVADLTPLEQGRAFLAGLYPESTPSKVTDKGLQLEKNHFIWIGDPWESGEDRHLGGDYSHKFRSVQDWLKNNNWEGQQVSKCTFKCRGPRRIRENIGWDGMRLFTLEADHLPHDQFGAVIRYAQKYSVLRSIVHSGGKSIHASFDYVLHKQAELFAVLAGLGADRQMLNSSLTTRMPGQERKDEHGQPTGKIQKLLYLNPSYTIV